jgi:chromosome segregation ATPase
MALFKKKTGPEFSTSEEDKLLDELEKETKKLGGMPPMPPAPAARAAPPVAPPRPMPPISPPAAKPSMTEKQVAKLPLFMKVEEYDKIVQELTTLVNSLKNMEDIMAKLSALEKEEGEEAKRWSAQLERTKDQVRLLLSQLPETGKLKDALKVKKRIEKKGGKKKGEEVEELKKEILKGQKVPAKKTKALEKEVDELRKNLNQLQRKKEEELGGEVDDLKDSIKGLQDELRHMHLEFKMLNSLTQLKSSKMLKGIKEGAAPKPTPKKVVNPWEE